MSRDRDLDVWTGRVNVVVTSLIFAAAIGIPYLCDRAYHRWLDDIDAFAWLPAGIERARAGLRQKHAGATEWAGIVSEVLREVDRARSAGNAR